MKLEKGQLVAVVKITSPGLSSNVGRRDVAATIEHIGSFKDPSDAVDVLKDAIQRDIGTKIADWDTLQRLSISVEFKNDSYYLTKQNYIKGAELKPITFKFECNTLGELQDVLRTEPFDGSIHEISVSFVMQSNRDNKTISYAIRNFSDDFDYKGKIRAARINQLKETGIAFYKDFKDIF